MGLFYMARTFRRKTGRKTRSNKKSTRRTRRKVGGSKAATFLAALLLAAQRAAAVPARSYGHNLLNITVNEKNLVARPNGSGYDISKKEIETKLGPDTLKDLEQYNNNNGFFGNLFSKKDVLSISPEDIEKYNMKTIRRDYTADDLVKASDAEQRPW